MALRLFVAVSTLLTRIGYLVGRLRPIRRQVVLDTGAVGTIGGNLAWIKNGLDAAMPGVAVAEIAYVERRSLRALLRASLTFLRLGYRLATARVFVVDDYFYPMYVMPHRKGTTYVQVWHACGAFKKFGYSVLDKTFGASERFVRKVPIHSTYDVCLVSADRFTPAYMEAFRLPRERFTARLGIPRTDLFFDPVRIEAASAEVRRRYRIPADRRVVLYAPTFRGVRTTAARDPLDLDFDVLHAALGDDHVVLTRSHPFVRARSRVIAGHHAAGDDPFVIDVSDHPDMNELMLVSDILVTDYSSAMYEFALLGRPIAFFAPDHAAYEEERSFYFDYLTGVPGPVFSETAGLAAWLRAGEVDLDRVRRFAAESFDVADGAATQRFIDEVVRPALEAPASSQGAATA